MSTSSSSSSEDSAKLRRLHEVSDEHADKLIKMLVLAKNGDEGEAANAMAAAQRYALKHQIDMASIEMEGLGESKGTLGTSNEPFISTDHKTAEGDCRRPPSHKFISWTLCRHFRVDIITYSGRHASKICVVGRKSDVAFAIYAYDFLVNTFNKLWRSYKQTSYASPDERNSYFYGLYVRLHDKLEKAAAETVRQELAQFGERTTEVQNKWDVMVVQESDLLKQAIKDQHPTLKYVKRGIGDINSQRAVSDGIRDGESIEINRPLTKDSQRSQDEQPKEALT